ncbi:uncharacterized protein cubi_00838 [Cryptosporidium ubiquitum]|uniref:Uncharacterized protein n=1 Tax=Cryptosporidium ubiquitum TaxID=857276 RepID=A0A1J4MF36_9CRYT|nr:uncharacterized protein cubi_00838 [Cryptosporidium ubiquitum]OII72866.1 hypothetical protein cubi_00838 [Cryptosporidium ubiquitum]
MGTKLVSNIKNFIISGRNQNGIKGLIKSSYPNGYRNFGPDLDRMMLPLNKKYVDASKLVDSINEETNNIGSCSVSGGKDNYYISVLKYLVDFIQWDIKKERENYAKYGMFLFLKLLESYKDHWADYIRVTGFIRNQSEIWLSKDNTTLQYYGKWIILGNMKKSLERNIHFYQEELDVLRDGTHLVCVNYNLGSKFTGLSVNSLPIKMCTLSHKLVEMLCKCLLNINTRLDNKKGKEKERLKEHQNGLTKDQSLRINEPCNRDLIEIEIILEIILLGFLIEGNAFEEKSGDLISDSVIPCLASIIDSKIILSYGLSFHNVKYYLNENGPGTSLYNTMNIFRQDNNLFFQGDKASPYELIESLYIKFLYAIETLSIIFSKESQEEKATQQKYSDAISGKVTSEFENNLTSQSSSCNNNGINGNELGLIQRFKVQDRINILPLKFKSLNDKLYSLYYYPYILTSDICLSICRGNSDYTVELITLLTCALRYHTINTTSNLGKDTENFQRLFQNNYPFFIIDELVVSISGGNEEIPRSILYYETPQYCYSLLRCLHRVLCCCPRIVGISRLVSTLINLIDVILPLYDLNGILCSRSKNLDGHTNTGGSCRGITGGSNRGITGGEMGKCALLMRNVSFQVMFDIMCILSDTSQVFYVIRVLVKVRDWCGSCLLDLIRRCQRLASQSSEMGISQRVNCKANNVQSKNVCVVGGTNIMITGNQKCDKSDQRTRTSVGSLQISNRTGNEANVSFSEGSKLLQSSSSSGSGICNSGVDLSSYLCTGGGLKEFGNEVDLETINPSFWSRSKILEIAGINKKWITGQIGNSGNNYISVNFAGGGVGGGMVNGLNSSSNMSLGVGIASGLSSDIIVSSKTTQVIFNRSENMGSNNSGNSGSGGALRADVIGGSASSVPSSSSSSAIVMGGGMSGSVNCGGILISKTVPPSSNYCCDYSSEDEDDSYDFDDIETSSDEEPGNMMNFRDGERRREGYRLGRRGVEEEEEEEEDDEEYWEVDQKLLELIRLRPTSSIVNAQPPTAGILRRTVSSDVNINKGTFSKIGSISSFWTKHNSAPPKTLSSMKRVCFAEVAQIY